MKLLPHIPSALILLALADLEACEKDPVYTINMGDWHCADGGGCQVCLAGAVMAKTLEACPYMTYLPTHFPKLNEKALAALDRFRLGNLAAAEDILGMTVLSDQTFVPTPYVVNPGKFKKEMREIAAAYAAKGF